MRLLNDDELVQVSGGDELKDWMDRIKEYQRQWVSIPLDEQTFYGSYFNLTVMVDGKFLFSAETGGYGGWFDTNNDGSDAGEEQVPNDDLYDLDGSGGGGFEMPGSFVMTPAIENKIRSFKPYGGA